MTENRRAFDQTHDAFRRRDPVAIRRALAQDPELRGHIDDPVFSFDAPAIVAFADDPAIVSVLLEFGADPNRRSDWWAGGFHALHSATGAAADILIAAGAVPDACAARDARDPAEVRVAPPASAVRLPRGRRGHRAGVGARASRPRVVDAIRDGHYHATPLGWCCRGSLHGSPAHDHAAVARLLLGAGARPGPDTEHASPAVQAALAA